MFNRIISIIVIGSFITTVVGSCSKDTSLSPEKKKSRVDENYEEILKSDPEVNELVEIGTKIIKQAMANEVSATELQIVYDNRDDKYFGILLGYEKSEMERIRERVSCLSNIISKRYPELVTQIKEKQKNKCSTCDFNKLISNWDRIVTKYDNQYRRKLAIDPAVCQMAPLAIGILVCAATAGASIILYAACTYVVVCSFCEGGWADDICAF